MSAARYYEDVEVGDALVPVVKGPMTSMHLMRWSAAIENWHRIHYDQPFATGHDGLPDIVVNGSWKQHVLAQLMKDFAGTRGWVLGIDFTYRGMDERGATVTAYGKVTGKHELAASGVVTCDVAIRNQRDQVTTSGTSLALLPFRSGPALPHPIDPDLATEAERLVMGT